MSWWKQVVLSIAVIAAAFLGWMAFVPSALPMLERAGLLQHLERVGLLQQLARIGVAVDGPAAGDRGGPQSAGGPPRGGPPGGFGGGGRATAVLAAPVAMTVRSNSVTAIGTGQALRSVSVTPEATGRIVEISVAPGDHVQAGTILARLDSSAEDIALDRAELVLADARATAERITRLQRSGAATDIQTRDAELTLRKAELDLRQAQLNLDRRAIAAPISGWVGFVDAELGDQVSPSTQLTGIDDRSSLLISFLVPERYVAALTEGMALRAVPLSSPGLDLEGRVYALDNRVDESSRSLRVQAEIANPDDRLRPGMAFAMTLEFTGETLPAVDPLAIQWSSNGAFVWAVRDGQAQRVPIRIVQRNADIVLLDAAVAEGDLVITEGVQSLRPGTAVEVRNAPQGTAAEQARANAPPTRAAPGQMQ